MATVRGNPVAWESFYKFRPQWLKLPGLWVEVLRQSRSANTYRLALTILVEAFKQEEVGGEIVLSRETTEISGSARARAVDELVTLGLIKIRRNGRQAVRVIRPAIVVNQSRIFEIDIGSTKPTGLRSASS